MKTKLKKLFKTWGIIALVFVADFLLMDKSRISYGFFMFSFAITGIFILFGWDKYITYGDEKVPTSSQTVPEDVDDMME